MTSATNTRAAQRSARMLAARAAARAKALEASGDKSQMVQDVLSMAYVIEVLCDALHAAEFRAGGE